MKNLSVYYIIQLCKANRKNVSVGFFSMAIPVFTEALRAIGRYHGFVNYRNAYFQSLPHYQSASVIFLLGFHGRFSAATGFHASYFGFCRNVHRQLHFAVAYRGTYAIVFTVFVRIRFCHCASSLISENSFFVNCRRRRREAAIGADVFCGSVEAIDVGFSDGCVRTEFHGDGYADALGKSKRTNTVLYPPANLSTGNDCGGPTTLSEGRARSCVRLHADGYADVCRLISYGRTGLIFQNIIHCTLLCPLSGQYILCRNRFKSYFFHK